MDIYKRALRSRSLRDQSLTHKGRLGPLFVRVPRCAPQLYFWNTVYTISKDGYHGYSPDTSQSDYFEICLLLYEHMTLLKVSNSESAYLFTFINIWKQASRFIFNYNRFDYFM